MSVIGGKADAAGVKPARQLLTQLGSGVCIAAARDDVEVPPLYAPSGMRAGNGVTHPAEAHRERLPRFSRADNKERSSSKFLRRLSIPRGRVDG